MSKKPIILMTVFRRYHELIKNLNRIHELKDEFSVFPEIVVVWARPELGMIYLFDELIKQGKVNKVFGRLPEVGEEAIKATTFAESINIRRGLEFVKENYGVDDYYVIVQTADIYVKDGTYKFIEKHIKNEMKAILFHWENAMVREHIWHTNFLVTSLDEVYWPPISNPAHFDVLERQYGLQIEKTNPPGVVKWHNYNNKRFIHEHLSENLPAYPRVGLLVGNNIQFYMSGTKKWYIRILDWFKGLVYFNKKEN